MANSSAGSRSTVDSKYPANLRRQPRVFSIDSFTSNSWKNLPKQEGTRDGGEGEHSSSFNINVTIPFPYCGAKTQNPSSDELRRRQPTVGRSRRGRRNARTSPPNPPKLNRNVKLQLFANVKRIRLRPHQLPRKKATKTHDFPPTPTTPRKRSSRVKARLSNFNNVKTQLFRDHGLERAALLQRMKDLSIASPTSRGCGRKSIKRILIFPH